MKLLTVVVYFLTFSAQILAAPRISYEVIRNEALVPGACVSISACLVTSTSAGTQFLADPSGFDAALQFLGIPPFTRDPLPICREKLLAANVPIAEVKSCPNHLGYVLVEFDKKLVINGALSPADLLNLILRQTPQGLGLVDLQRVNCR